MHSKKGLVLAAAGVVLWLTVGTFVYWGMENCSEIPRFRNGLIDESFHQCPWTFGQSFYFSVQTGLSIGFGLLAESKKHSMLYSCFHILAGSSFISGALALFASIALSRSHNFQDKQERRLAKAGQNLHLDFYDGVDLNELKDLMVTQPHYAHVVIRKTYKDSKIVESKIAQLLSLSGEARTQMIHEILGDAVANVKEFSKGKLSIEEIRGMEDKTANRLVRLRRFCRKNRNFLVVNFVFWSWIAIGVIFYCAAVENDFITGLYFAVSTLSTAGMVSVVTVDSNLHVWFVGFFALMGIPIYCAYLGFFASILVESYTNKQVQEKLHSRLSDAERAFLDHLSKSDKDAEVDFAEFLEFQLLRLGVIDADMIKRVRDQFRELDTNNSGTVPKAEFLHSYTKHAK